jgi:hypothetical protein
MSEPTYPPAWGLYEAGEWQSLSDDQELLRSLQVDGESLVRLIPEPTVESESRHNYGIWSRWVEVVKGVVQSLPDDQREAFIIACREYKGPCFCGCHTSEVQS